MDALFLRIFDAFVEWKPLKRLLFSRIDVQKLRRIYVKICNRETVVYTFFGGLTTLVSLVSFALLDGILTRVGWQGLLHYALPKDNYAYIDANSLSWIITVLFAFVTNKQYVFKSRSWRPRVAMRELRDFTVARLVSYGIEVGLLALFVSVLSFHKLLSKVVVMVIIVIVNYVFSKLFIFKGEKKTPPTPPSTQQD